MKHEPKETEEPVWILFLDFAKAYDVVNYDLLFKKMRRLDIQEKTIQGLQLMFNNLVIQSELGNMHIGRGLG